MKKKPLHRRGMDHELGNGGRERSKKLKHKTSQLVREYKNAASDRLGEM